MKKEIKKFYYIASIIILLIFIILSIFIFKSSVQNLLINYIFMICLIVINGYINNVKIEGEFVSKYSKYLILNILTGISSIILFILSNSKIKAVLNVVILLMISLVYIVIYFITSKSSSELKKIENTMNLKKKKFSELLFLADTIKMEHFDNKNVLNLCDKIKYSDPISNESVFDLENEIEQDLKKLQKDFNENLISSLINKIEKRNMILKNNK